MTDNFEITKQQEDVIRALVTCKTKRQASQVSGVSEATIYRLLKKPEFVEMLETVRKQVYYNTIFNLSSLSTDSIECLYNLLHSPTSRDSIKYKASSFILNKTIDIVKYNDLNTRLTRLEKINGIKY